MEFLQTDSLATAAGFHLLGTVVTMPMHESHCFSSRAGDGTSPKACAYIDIHNQHS